MLLLLLEWIGIGLVVGALALGARLRPAAWGERGWLALLGIGAGTGLLGGLLGMVVFGRLFGAATALWIAVLAVALVPRLLARQAARTQVSKPTEP